MPTPHTTNRRTLLAAMAAAPVTLSSAAVSAVQPTARDPNWDAIVADFHAKRAAWIVTADGEDKATPAYRASLPPEPAKPASASTDGILDKTLREIRDGCDTPTDRAAWAKYESDHAAWEEEKDALREKIVGPAAARHAAAWQAYLEALNKIIAYRATTLTHLREKIEIVAADYQGDDIPEECFGEILADVRHLATGVL